MFVLLRKSKYYDDFTPRLSVYNISNFQNFVEKIQRSFNNINIEMASISSSLKAGLSQFPSCDNLKKLLEEFKKGVSGNAFMGEDCGCYQSQVKFQLI